MCTAGSTSRDVRPGSGFTGVDRFRLDFKMRTKKEWFYRSSHFLDLDMHCVCEYIFYSVVVQLFLWTFSTAMFRQSGSPAI